MIAGRRARVAAIVACFLTAAASAGIARQTPPRKPASPPAHAARLAFVPLDDRPRSLGDVARVAAVADVEVVTPPEGILSRHLKTGDGDGLARWLDALDVNAVDAVVVSTDMLAYGGILGSRTGRVLEPDARRRLEAIDRLKARRADLPVYAFTSLMRQAPTDDGGNPGWREALTNWARHSVSNDDPGAEAAARKAEDALPAGMLDAYKATRARNLALTLSMIERASSRVVDFLVIGDDEPLEVGVQVAERAHVAAAIAASGASDRVVTREGVDEVAALLVARGFLSRSKAAPTARVTYSSDAVRSRTRDVVATDLKVIGAREAAVKGPATVALEVFASGESAPAEALARRVLAPGNLVAVADVGEADGGSLGLLETLRSSKAFTRLAGFAAGPTPQAAVATSLVHALAVASVVDRAPAARPRDVLARVAKAHARHLLGRAIEGVLYREVVAPQAVEEILAPRKIDPNAVPEKERPRLATYIEKEMTPLAHSLVGDFGTRPWSLPSRSGKAAAQGIVVKDLTTLTVSFPWGEVGEPDIAFDLLVDAGVTAPRPPPPRILR
jgi:hypothetical protein